MSDLRPLFAAALLLSLPVATQAQSETSGAPAGSAQYGAPGYGYGYPPPYPFPPAGMMPPGAAPWSQGPWGEQPPRRGGYPQGGDPGWLQSEPGGPMAPETGAPGPSRAPGAVPAAMPGQLRIMRKVTDDAYLVRIMVGEGKTGEVQVTPMGRGLAISRTAEAETVQEDTFGDGRGYQRSFSFSRGSLSRRIGLPPDADLAHMTREESGGNIVLRIPRVPMGRGFPPNPSNAEPQAAPVPPAPGQ